MRVVGHILYSNVPLEIKHLTYGPKHRLFAQHLPLAHFLIARAQLG